MSRQRAFLVVILAIIGSVLFGACGGQQTSPAQPTSTGSSSQAAQPAGKEITVTVAQDTAFAVLDPAGAGKVRAEPEILRHVYDNLVRFKADMSVEPDLAESWTVSDDGKTWTFKLREGVKFHDGSDFTADAVRFSFDRLVDEKKAFLNRGLFASVLAEVKVVDPLTVQLITKAPFGPMLNYLAHHSAGIVSPTAVQKWGDDFAIHPVGTGPYKVTEVVRGERVSLSKNPDYFGTKPVADKIVFRAIVEEGARTAALESGQVDIATGLGAQDAQRLKGAGFTTAAVPSLQAQYLGINVKRPNLSDVRVRQALNYAIDKQAIVKTVFLDTFTVLDSVLTPGSFGYKSQDSKYDYNPSKAKELLSAAGFGPSKPLKLILWTPDGLYPRDVVVAQAIQAQLKEVGVEVTIEKQESGGYFTVMKKPTAQANYDLFMWAFVPSTADGYQTLQNNLLSDAEDTPGYFNYSRYKNSQFDDLVNKAGVVTDMKQRTQLLEQAQKMAWEDAPYVYLYTIGIVNGYKKGVTGVQALPTRYMDLTQAMKN